MDSCFVFNREDVSSAFSSNCVKHKDVISQFSAMRRVRGDGNCFYRALIFNLLEFLRNKGSRSLQRFKEEIIQSENLLMSSGFDEKSIKRLLNTVVNMLEQLESADDDDDDDEDDSTLLRLFNEPLTSDSMVQYLRLLTSSHLKKHADFFCHFVEAPDLKVYCEQEVEVMGMECDHVDILALLQALNISIHVVSLDGDEEQLVHHVIPEGSEPCLHLLYQTSHYNILYPPPPL